MRLQLAFALGWLTHWIQQRPPSVGVDLDTLRAEVREARLVVADLVDLRTGCSTELWWQRWVIRANVVVDLFLIGLIIRNWLFRVTTQVPVIRADTRGSSSSEDEPGALQSGPPLGGLVLAKVKVRPTRPSDLRK